MKLTNKLKFVLFSVMCAASYSAVARDKTESGRDSASQEIRALFKSQDEANWSGATPEQLAHRFYTEDAIIIGEGETKTERGMKDAITALVNWNAYLGPGGNKACHFEVLDPIIASGDMASVFATLSCKANPPKREKPEAIRQLFVLKRTAQGWRVAQEMWQMGTMEH
ncbi:YybH family protein [Massilia orientalis]|uniref:YybH family protein n=1 Tax=Massilia orientalis TaxID=3050128 RepID=A0ACC7MLN3_9BURK|nr:nuclear transport factor 2 family protein [Massilia sp. YIM B02787]